MAGISHQWKDGFPCQHSNQPGKLAKLPCSGQRGLCAVESAGSGDGLEFECAPACKKLRGCEPLRFSEPPHL